MKVCKCGSDKWKTKLDEYYIQCLKCYAKYTPKQLKKLKDKI